MARWLTRQDVATSVTFELEIPALTEITRKRQEPAAYPIGVGDRLPDVWPIGGVQPLHRDRHDLALLGVLPSDMAGCGTDLLGDVDHHSGSSFGLGGLPSGTRATCQLGAEGIEPGAPVLPELLEPAIHLP